MSAHPYSPLVLGVDPDVEAPGVALYHARRGCLVYCGALGLRAFVAWLRAGADPAALGLTCTRARAHSHLRVARVACWNK